MTSKEIKIMSDKKYWDEIYYSNLKESEKDFLNDIWMEKYNDIKEGDIVEAYAMVEIPR